MWRVLLVLLCGCRTLAPPPDDLDAYCAGVLERSKGPLPPECANAPEHLKEREWRTAHPYAACVKDAAAQRRKCIMAVAVGGTGPGILTAFTGVESKRDSAALEAGCNADYSVAVQVCDAEAR